MPELHPPTAPSVPVLVIVDAGYVGHESVAAELGPAFDVTFAVGFDQAVAALTRLASPIVLVPDNLEPLRGAPLLARLDAQGLDFHGLLLLDEPDLRRLPPAPLPGVHALAQRPLHPGALALHVLAAASARARASSRDRSSSRAVADLDELIKALRHELRAQLQGMVGLGGLLAEFERARLSDEGRDWLRRLVQSGERVSRLVDDLVAHLRLGQRPLEPGPVDVAALVADLADDLQDTHPAADIAFLGPRLRLHADRRALSQALRHLLDNAARFHPGPEPHVRVAVVPGDPSSGRVDGFTLSVTDDGPGLPEAACERVFTLFERHHHDADGTRAGAGVGLATVARVASLHGGRAWVTPASPRGAAFHLWLPDPA